MFHPLEPSWFRSMHEAPRTHYMLPVTSQESTKTLWRFPMRCLVARTWNLFLSFFSVVSELGAGGVSGSFARRPKVFKTVAISADARTGHVAVY